MTLLAPHTDAGAHSPRTIIGTGSGPVVATVTWPDGTAHSEDLVGDSTRQEVTFDCAR